LDDQSNAFLPCSYGADSSAKFTFNFGGSNGANIDVSLSTLLTPATDDNGQAITLSDGSTACFFELQGGASDGQAILGDAFLRSAYVLYDLDNNQIGLAQTVFNATSSNVQEISGSSVPGATSAGQGVTASAAPTAAATDLPGGGGFDTTAALTATQATITASVAPSFHFTQTAAGPVHTTTKAAAANIGPVAPVGIATVIAGTVTVLSMFGGALMMLL
jgi:hypothetical protein